MLNKRILHTTYIIFVSCFFVALFFSLMPAAPIEKHGGDFFKSLQKRLEKSGLEKKRLEKLYHKPQVFFDLEGVALFFKHKEGVLNYGQFTSKKAIQKAKNYKKVHQAELLSAEKTYGVDNNVITAIILVETRFGTILGKRLLINTLSTLASLSDPEAAEVLWERVSNSNQLTKSKFDAWTKRKSKWAFSELKAFLEYTKSENIDPLDISGSYAGAAGIAQFMPSNMLMFGKDGNKDGVIDMFNHADAIASIGSYLKHYGWHPGIDEKKAYKVVYHYNHSSYYVNTILKIAEFLKE